MSTHIRSEVDYNPERVSANADRFIVISGCSGGGKSSLLAELARRGLPTYGEAGRQVIKEQIFIGGNGVPRDNFNQFIELTVSRSIHYLVLAAGQDGPSFFDLGIVDQISGLEHLNHPVPTHLLTAAKRFRYHERVFMVPPWPEIFTSDSERRHDYDSAVSSYEMLARTYRRLGYRLETVLKGDITMRADFVLDNLPDSLSAAAD